MFVVCVCVVLDAHTLRCCVCVCMHQLHCERRAPCNWRDSTSFFAAHAIPNNQLAVFFLAFLPPRSAVTGVRRVAVWFARTYNFVLAISTLSWDRRDLPPKQQRRCRKHAPPVADCVFHRPSHRHHSFASDCLLTIGRAVCCSGRPAAFPSSVLSLYLSSCGRAHGSPVSNQ